MGIHNEGAGLLLEVLFGGGFACDPNGHAQQHAHAPAAAGFHGHGLLTLA